MSALSDQGQANQENPLNYAPRWLREKPEQRFSVIEESRPAQERRPETLPRSMSSPSPLDSQLESAVYESLRRQLDPEVMEEPTGLARELDRRDALFGVAGRFALAIGVSALVAVFFVFMIPASRQPDAGTSLSSTLEQMKAALTLSQPAQHEDAKPTANVDANVNATAKASGNTNTNTNTSTDTSTDTSTKTDTSTNTSAIVNTGVNLPEVPTIRSSSETSPPVTHEQSEKLLQQFMQWQQKPAQ
jgi:Sec-independent protein translocase protein TatA